MGIETIKSLTEQEAVDIITKILKKNDIEGTFKIKFLPEKNNKSYNMFWDINYKELSINRTLLSDSKPFISLIGHELVHFENQDKVSSLSLLTKEGKLKSIMNEVRADLDGYAKVKDFISKEDYLKSFKIQKDRTEGYMRNPEKDSYRLGYPCYNKRIELATKYDSFTEDTAKELKQYFSNPKFEQQKGIKR